MLSVIQLKPQTAEPSGQNTGENISHLQAERLKELIKTAEMELGRLFARLRTPAGRQHALHQALADGSTIDDLFLNLIESKLNKFCRSSSLRGLESPVISPTPTAPERTITPRSTVIIYLHAAKITFMHAHCLP